MHLFVQAGHGQRVDGQGGVAHDALAALPGPPHLAHQCRQMPAVAAMRCSMEPMSHT